MLRAFKGTDCTRDEIILHIANHIVGGESIGNGASGSVKAVA